MGYILKVVLANPELPAGLEVITLSKDLLDETLRELDTIIQTNGRKSIEAIMIIRESESERQCPSACSECHKCQSLSEKR